ncbi:hypothetical protein MSAN_00467200 [Mycena sanguinolenta]|uniref:Uncharacterized protein n=1 Tax=Mycena sanguinolenta TaxID=230812 RepID=A0A8H7DIQ3_9AGAR|nr:hypothetical protein MSAN_00467200 [Mycena sanguinolenta]
MTTGIVSWRGKGRGVGAEGAGGRAAKGTSVRGLPPPPPQPHPAPSLALAYPPQRHGRGGDGVPAPVRHGSSSGAFCRHVERVGMMGKRGSLVRGGTMWTLGGWSLEFLFVWTGLPSAAEGKRQGRSGSWSVAYWRPRVEPRRDTSVFAMNVDVFYFHLFFCEAGGSASASSTRRLLTLTFAAGAGMGRKPARTGRRGRQFAHPSLRHALPIPLVVLCGVEILKQAGGGGGDTEGDGHRMHRSVLGAGFCRPCLLGGGGGNDLELGILTPHALYVCDLATGHVSARVACSLAPAPASAVPKDAKEFKVAERIIVVVDDTYLTHLRPPRVPLPPSVLAVPLLVPHSHHHPHQQALTSDSMSPSSVSPSASAIRSPTSPTRTPTLASGDGGQSEQAATVQAPTLISALHGPLLALLAPPPVVSPPISALSLITLHDLFYLL